LPLNRQNPGYSFAYALVLQKQHEFSKAEALYYQVLQLYRELAESNPAAHRADVAITLNNLGILSTPRSGWRKRRAPTAKLSIYAGSWPRKIPPSMNPKWRLLLPHLRRWPKPRPKLRAKLHKSPVVVGSRSNPRWDRYLCRASENFTVIGA